MAQKINRKQIEVVAFRATTSSTSSIPDATHTKLIMNVEEYDYGNNYDAVTNFRFVAPVNGVYHFNGAFSPTSDSRTRIILSLYKNGSPASRGIDLLVNGTSIQTKSAVVSDDLYLDAGQYVELFVYTGGGSLPVLLSYITYFSGHLIAGT